MQKFFRKVDIVTAKGKTLPVSIYEGLGDNHPLLSKLESWDLWLWLWLWLDFLLTVAVAMAVTGAMARPIQSHGRPSKIGGLYYTYIQSVIDAALCNKLQTSATSRKKIRQ